MSGLALAGAISGMGQGLQQGLVNMQQGFIQSGLLKERDEMENKRMLLTFEHQEKLQTEKIASDRAIHADALTNAKEINAATNATHVQTTGMSNDTSRDINKATIESNNSIHKDLNGLNEKIANMKDNRERLNTEASLDISKNSSYVKIIDEAVKSIDRIRVDQVVLEKAAAMAAPGDPIFDRIKELDRQLGVAQKEVDLYKGALGSRIGAPALPTAPKFKIPSGLERPAPEVSAAPTESAPSPDSSSPVADFQIRRPLTPKTGMVDAITGTYTPILGSIADAIRRAGR